MKDTERSELLTAYDENMSPIGNYPRSEIHAKGMLHRTIRLWIVSRHGIIWFQRKSESKSLFPCRLDPAATGHVDPGEDPKKAAIREAYEELDLPLKPRAIKALGEMPFAFERPDGALDNERASIFLYEPDLGTRLYFKTNDEISEIVAIAVRDYDRLIESGGIVYGTAYRPNEDNGRPVMEIETVACGPSDFCVLNKEEWRLVRKALGK